MKADSPSTPTMADFVQLQQDVITLAKHLDDAVALVQEMCKALHLTVRILKDHERRLDSVGAYPSATEPNNTAA